MANKRCYDTDEAIAFVLEPGSDSEMSDLEQSDDEMDETYVPIALENESDYDEVFDENSDARSSDSSKNKDNETVENSISETINDSASTAKPTELSSTNSGIGNTSNEQGTKKKQPAHKWRWRAKEPPAGNIDFRGKQFDNPPDNFNEMCPIDFFRIFWTNNITQRIVEQTNLYSVQEQGKSISTCVKEIEQFLGMHILMGVMKLPDYNMYWASETRYPKIADVMSNKRYKLIRKNIHVVDNTTREESGNKTDKLFKIRPVLEAVRENTIAIDPEPVHSIDEQIIPAKTKRSGIRQYNPKKPKKWGFKMFVRAGQSGMMYDFFLYAGKGSANKSDCSAANVVLRLSEGIPQHQNFKLCFDNWFCTLPLCLELKSLGILTTATIRANRLADCPLKCEKDLKKEGRGSSSYRSDANSGIVLIRWFDNKSVQLVSTYSSPVISGTVKRWDPLSKQHIEVPCPEIVKEYNSAMGGVDLADMLIALYRSPMKSNRWYLKVLIHCVDICKVNAWLLYRRYANQLSIPKKNQMALLQFSCKISDGLLYEGKPVDRPIGRPPKRKSLEDNTEGKGRRVVTPTPSNCSRTDETGHWPVFRDKKSKCRFCKKGIIRTSCMKCMVYLCLTSERNCFYEFHCY